MYDMNNRVLPLILSALIAIATFIWGISGIVQKDRIRNRADYMLSVGQVVGSLIILIAVICFAVFKLKS